MGQKIHPFKYRLGITRNWVSRWFPRKSETPFRLEEDLVIRKIVDQKIAPAGIVRVEIERGANNAYRIFIKAARPGLVIGRGGQGIEDLSVAINAALIKLDRRRKKTPSKRAVSLTVEELKRTEVASKYVAQQIAWDIERRMPFRRVMKKQIEAVMQNREVQGVKIRLAGRLNGSEIARVEWLAKGKMPLQTLRADIDYGEATSFNTYGTIGIKVWIYKGELFDKNDNSQNNK